MVWKCKRKALFFPPLTGRDMPKNPSISYPSRLHFHVRGPDSSIRPLRSIAQSGIAFQSSAPKKLTPLKSMGMSFLALPSQQGSVQGRFKPAHDSAELVAGRPISLSIKVAACVRRFETPTPLNDGRPALALSLWRCVSIGEHFTSLLFLLMPYEPGLGQGQSQKKTSPCSPCRFFHV